MSEATEAGQLWSDERIGEEAYKKFHLYANHTCPDGVEVKLRCTPTIYCADLMQRVRNDMQTRIAQLEAERNEWQQAVVKQDKLIDKLRAQAAEGWEPLDILDCDFLTWVKRGVPDNIRIQRRTTPTGGENE